MRWFDLVQIKWKSATPSVPWKNAI